MKTRQPTPGMYESFTTALDESGQCSGFSVVSIEQQPVAWLRHGERVPVQNVPLGAMWISDKDDPRAFPVYASPAPVSDVKEDYLVWSNEHKCWWGPDHAGYVSSLADAGRYSREEALKICVNARGGRQFNSNPSEVPLPLADAELFWPDDKEEWRVARHKHDHPDLWEDEE